MQVQQQQIEHSDTQSLDSVLRYVLKDDISKIWHDIKHHVETICRNTHDIYSKDDILRKLEKSEMHLWLSLREEIEGICITEFWEFPQKKYLNIFGVSGHSLKNWSKFMKELEGFAEYNDCDAVMMIGRKGWERIYPDYKLTEQVLMKDL